MRVRRVYFLVFSIVIGVFFGFQKQVFAVIPDKPHIISRESWGAQENFTLLRSQEWKDIIQKRQMQTSSQVDSEHIKKIQEDRKRAREYIQQNFSKENTVIETRYFDKQTGKRLAWPHQYTEYVNSIILHHTDGVYESDQEALHKIYKFHSIDREWGDIGYHYIIGASGDIYEGKKGGDYVVGAHSKWNNYSSIGIAIIGNYSEHTINDKQYKALQKLVVYLSWRYGIDTNTSYYYHRDCKGESCLDFPIETNLSKRFIGHRDSGHTSCPGDALYAQLGYIQKYINHYSQGFIPIRRGSALRGIREPQVPIPENTDISQKLEGILRKLNQEELENISHNISQLDADNFSKSGQVLIITIQKLIDDILAKKTIML